MAWVSQTGSVQGHDSIPIQFFLSDETTFIFFVWWSWDSNSEPHTCQTRALLKPRDQSYCFGYFSNRSHIFSQAGLDLYPFMDKSLVAGMTGMYHYTQFIG